MTTNIQHFGRLCIIFYFARLDFVSGAQKFCYGNDPICGPSSWGGKCNLPDSKHQSPIDLLPPPEGPLLKPNLTFSKTYQQDYTEFDILNNGHTIQVRINKTKMGELIVSWIENKSYVLAQAHFHWGIDQSLGSEHTIDKQKFNFETHFVHYNNKYGNIRAAALSGDPTGLLVLGSLRMNRSVETPKLFEGIRAGIIALKNDSCEGKPITVKNKINFYNLLGHRVSSTYFLYVGSLTTPNCNEAVQWYLFEVKTGILPADLEAFSSVQCSGKKIGNNFRPIQPLNDRNITYYSK